MQARAQADIATRGYTRDGRPPDDVTQLSIELAEHIVERNLDRDTQLRLIDSYINQVGSN